MGTALLRLADADILPFEFGGTASTLLATSTSCRSCPTTPKAGVDLKPLRKSIDGLRTAAEKYEAALGRTEAGRNREASRN